YSIRNILVNLHCHAHFPAAVYLIAKRYCYRLCVLGKKIPITKETVYALAVASVRVAEKYLIDSIHAHKTVAMAVDMETSELTKIEMAFCFLLGFELGV
ncbi:hypothetical protein K470DRAFT_197464, partial [Piedraia hortae CBS 480.64]